MRCEGGVLNEPKNQHLYVPKSIIKNFVDPLASQKKVFSARKDRPNRVRNCSPKKVFTEPDVFTLRNERPEDRYRVENYISRAENGFAAVYHQKIRPAVRRQECPTLSANDFVAVISFFALQARRSLAGRRAAADYIRSDEAVDDLTNDFIGHPRKKYIGYNNIILPNTYDNVRSCVALGLERVDVKEMSAKSILVQEDVIQPNSLIHELCRRGLTIEVIKNPTPMNSFVLGNNPIIEAGNGGSSDLRINTEAERILPTAPDVCISSVGPTGSVRLALLDDIGHIKDLNLAVTKRSTEIVASNRGLLENLGRSVWWGERQNSA
ncbi:MAG: DUF4238 domain-containing protein [Desulfurellaceae bacterium]|nr:DUF4238 domain-containing protein [Desulfurellaceae bacterium]